MTYDPNDTSWLGVYGIIPPRLDRQHMCPCRCHSIVSNRGGLAVIEGRLGVLLDPIDHITACQGCVLKHSYTIWQEKRKGAA